MSQVTRFGVSMDEELLAKFDALAKRRGAANRSEAIRDLIRDALVEEGWQSGKGEAMAAVVIVYDHHSREINRRLNHIQHERTDAVVSSLHIHMDEHRCMEIIVLRGERGLLNQLAYRIIGTRGVIHGRMVTSTTGKELA
ncbi:MAG: nickel-responsive transcriptional regulator NikR [Planctomycetota bacterium]